MIPGRLGAIEGVKKAHLEGPRNPHIACVIGVSQAKASEVDVLQGILSKAAPPVQPCRQFC